jgi:cytochrome c oxidase subunit 3
MFAAADPASDSSRTPFRDRAQRLAAGRFGMWLLLLSLSMLFGASLIAFLVIRLQLADVWPSEIISLPTGLWASTIVLLLSSATMEAAVRSAHRGSSGWVIAGLAGTFVLGLLFLAVQVQCWLVALAELRLVWFELGADRLAATGFYVFSGVHGLHVIGGLIPMAVITVRAIGRHYGPGNCGGVQFIAMYWHFLGGVWIVLFTTLLLGM